MDSILPSLPPLPALPPFPPYDFSLFLKPLSGPR
jgi:hypothetical protein